MNVPRILNDARLARFENARTIDGVIPEKTDTGSILVAGKSTLVTREQMVGLPVPAATRTHTPVPHDILINTIDSVLGDNHLRVATEKFAVNSGGNALFGVMDIAGLPTGDASFMASMGIRASNDKSMAIQIAVGAKVFVCDNLALAGDMIALNRKHTGNLNLTAEIIGAVGRFMDTFATVTGRLNQMKNQEITDGLAKNKMYDIFAREIVSPRFLPVVDKAYFQPTDDEFQPRTMWSLHNAFTWALKASPLPSQQKATLALAKEFGL